MTSTYVAFDTRSGQILGVHYGAVDADEVRASAQDDAKISAEHVAVITVPYETVERGKQYKVDVDRNTLVEVAAGAGVGFAFGEAGQPS